MLEMKMMVKRRKKTKASNNIEVLMSLHTAPPLRRGARRGQRRGSSRFWLRGTTS